MNTTSHTTKPTVAAPPEQKQNHPFVGVLFVALGLLLLGFSAILAVRSYTPIPVWDQWIFSLTLAKNAGHFHVADLWAQHNEHRPVLLRLLCLADYAWFSGTNLFLYGCLLIGHLLDAALLVWLAWRFAGWRGQQLWVWAGLVLALLFTPAQRENFTWAWQVCFITLLLSATGATGALLTHVSQWRANGRRWTPALAAALILGLLAWLSLAAGLVVVVLLTLLGWWLRSPGSNLLVLAGAALVGTLLYFWNYQVPTHHISPVVALTKHSGRVILFMLAYLGGLTSQGAAKSVTLAYLTGAAGLAMGCAALWQSLRARAKGEPRLFPAAMLFFMAMAVATAIPTATARVVLQGDQPIVSRYQSIAVFFWLGLAGYCLELWRGRARRCLAVASAAMVLALFPLTTTRELQAEEEEREVRRSRAAMAVASDVDEKEFIPVILPHGRDWGVWRAFVESRHLTLFADLYFRLLGQPLTVLSAPSGTLRACYGFVDSGSAIVIGEKPSGIVFTGWAWDQDQKKPIRNLVIVDEQNRITGYAQTSVARGDVTLAVPTITNDRVGWQGYGPVSLLGRKVRVFGVEGQSITCRLAPEFTLTTAR